MHHCAEFVCIKPIVTVANAQFSANKAALFRDLEATPRLAMKFPHRKLLLLLLVMFIAYTLYAGANGGF